MRRFKFVTLAAGAMIVLAGIGSARADVSWTLSGATFLSNDSTATGTLTGGFTTDDSGNFLTWDITETRTNGTMIFDSSAGSTLFNQNNPPAGYGELLLSADGEGGLRIWFEDPLTVANNPDQIATSLTFSNNSPFSDAYEGLISGEAVTGSAPTGSAPTGSAPVAEPVSLSLLGMGLFGVVAARRRTSMQSLRAI